MFSFESRSKRENRTSNEESVLETARKVAKDIRKTAEDFERMIPPIERLRVKGQDASINEKIDALVAAGTFAIPRLISAYKILSKWQVENKNPRK